MNKFEETPSLASEERIQKLFEEAENELTTIQPEIDFLEKSLAKLNDLKRKKEKLLSLKASLKALLNETSIKAHNTNKAHTNVRNDSGHLLTSHSSFLDTNISCTQSEHNIFMPEVALSDVKQFLRTNNNLNYEIFKAVTYNAGEATTEDIKDYLVQNKIRQPKTGKYFDNVELKEISSRANYLVRKQLLISSGPGRFRCSLGFVNNN